MFGGMTRRHALQSLAAVPLGAGLLGRSSLGLLGQSEPTRFDDALRHAPTPMPDRICLTWADEPTTSQAVNWRTDISVRRAVAEVAIGQRGPDVQVAAQRVEAVTTHQDTMLGPAHYHKAYFTGLEPDTLYQYRVGDGQNWSEWYKFRTAAASRPESFRFLYLGDTQNDIQSQASRVARQAILDCPDARFVLHAGDLVNRGDRDDEWGEWFRAYDLITPMYTQLAVPGNHDYEIIDPEDRNVRRLAEHWYRNFDYPVELETFEQSVWCFDIMGVRVIGINSMERLADQAEWLESKLNNHDSRWTIVMFHHPIYSSGNDRDSTSRRNLLEPIFDRNQVDLVLQGHDHTYARSGLVKEGQIVQENGTLYMTSVVGPKMYRLTLSDVHVSGAARTQLYQIITATEDRLTVEAKTATGETHDHFAIERSGANRRLVEIQTPQIYNVEDNS